MNSNNLFNKNFYSVTHEFDLQTAGSNNTFGKTIVRYEIYKRIDVANLSNVKGYFLIVKQRLIIPNMSEYIAGATTISSYENYPAIIQNKIGLNVNNQANIRIHSIFPKTLNSNVTTNLSNHSGNTKSVSHQNTTGSTTSNVNTFGVGVSGGMFGAVPFGALSLSYSHSWIHGTSKQTSDASASSSQSDESFSDSMSVKDWSAYSSLSNDNKSLTWTWGQSYPWDVILYNQSSGGNNIKLPKFISERLNSEGLVLPPSELSLFGVDFTSQASWIIEFPEGVSENELININHETSAYTASHSVTNDQVSAVLQSTQEASYTKYTLGDLDLSLYSLATIPTYPTDGVATLGFFVDQFSYAPKTYTDKFKIASAVNDIQVTGTGFDSVMVTTFKSDVELNIYFKIEDSSFNYTLNLIHWLDSSSGDCNINWTINDKYTGITSISNIKNANSRDNMTQISLRDLDYKSINYFDYLTLGLNKITLSISPSDKTQGQNYEYTLSSITIR